MKQLIFTTVLLTLLSYVSGAQSVGIGTNTPASSAALDVSSSNKGLLVPRMSTTQRMSIPSPAKGLLVYDTVVNSLHHYTGTNWAPVDAGLPLPYAGSIYNSNPAFSIINGGGKAITGSTNGSFAPAMEGTGQGTGSIGVSGISHSLSGYGIYGQNQTGTAVYGYSGNGGTALKGNSPTGYALVTNGNLRLTGGNTNPEAGAVLTSVDASGNAIWKPRSIAFKAYGTHSSFAGVTMSSASRKMHFASEQYDYGNNFTTTTSSSPSEAMSTFEAPISGLYHFDVGVKLTLDDTYDDFRAVNVFVMLRRNNADFNLLTLSTQCCNANLGYEVSLYGSVDRPLEAGDAIRVQIYQWNDDDATAKLTNSIENYFAGHLVFAH